MGREKSLISVDGTTLARRSADLLERVVTIAVEVGPGRSGLAATREDSPGDGPLAGIVAGRRWLRSRGHTGAALVVACDLPFLNEGLLTFLREYDASGSVVPVVAGRAQPLLARWSAHDLDEASLRYEGGERSLRHLTEGADAVLLDKRDWGAVASEATFRDLDTPDDLVRYRLAP